MNAPVQALRAIPELQAALDVSAPPSTDITSALRDLFAEMDRVKLNKGTVTPTNLLQQLRAAVPQFSTIDRSGMHYAQQGQSLFLFVVWCLNYFALL
jgi:ubiquitin carboxyl-terminal hydrolase 14